MGMGSRVNEWKGSKLVRAAIQGGQAGLVSIASLIIMAFGSGQPHDTKARIQKAFAGLVAGACVTAIREFVSVSSEADMELARMEREINEGGERERSVPELPGAVEAAATAGLAFTVGGIVPLLAGCFIRDSKLRTVAVAVATSVAFVLVGCLAAAFGRSPLARSALRSFVGGCAAIAITCGMMKLVGLTGGK